MCCLCGARCKDVIKTCSLKARMFVQVMLPSVMSWSCDAYGIQGIRVMFLCTQPPRNPTKKTCGTHRGHVRQVATLLMACQSTIRDTCHGDEKLPVTKTTARTAHSTCHAHVKHTVATESQKTIRDTVLSMQPPRDPNRALVTHVVFMYTRDMWHVCAERAATHVTCVMFMGRML